MIEELLAVVQADNVGSEEPTHPNCPVVIGRFHHQVKVVSHEAIRADLSAGLLASLLQGFEEVLAIHIMNKNVLPVVAPVHEVVDGPRDTPLASCAA
jgi:hypothetical protein